MPHNQRNFNYAFWINHSSYSLFLFLCDITWIHFTLLYFMIILIICGALSDLAPFVQFKKREKTLQPATSLKVTLLYGCFSRFLNCENGAKLRKASHMTFFGIIFRKDWVTVLMSNFLINYVSEAFCFLLEKNHYNFIEHGLRSIKVFIINFRQGRRKLLSKISGAFLLLQLLGVSSQPLLYASFPDFQQNR